MVNSKKSAANDLFLLMLNLSQMLTKEIILEVFIGALNEIWPNIEVKYLKAPQESENNFIQISTAESTYGYLHIDNSVELDSEDLSLLHNACGMLAVVLKKIEQEVLLADEKLLLQKSVQERTQHLSKEIEERKKSEKKYHSLFENINVGVALHEIIVNEDGKPIDFVYLEVNPTFEILTTLKKEDVVGKRGLDVIPNLEQKWIDLYGEVALTGKSVSIIDHSDFLDKYWDIKAYSPGKNQFAVALTDITDKIQAEQDIIKAKEKAEKNEELLNLTGETAKVGGWNLNFELNKVLWTRETGRIHELPDDYIPTLEEAITFYHKEDQKLVKESVDKAIEKGIPYEIEARLITAKGNLVWVNAIGKPEMQDGKCIELSGSFQDITEKKQKEKELINAKQSAEENEEKYKLLHENAGLGIGYFSPDGTVISFNSIASKDMNGVPEDFAGKSVFELFPKEFADNYFDRIQKAVNTDEITVYEDCVQLPTQEKWFLSTYTKIVNSHAKVLGIQIISQNVTEIKQSEIDLINAKEKAEESDRLKSAFLANMSHEIRTPMNGILGFTELLQDPNLSVENQKNYTNIIEKSGERLLNTVNDIIEISKIESGDINVAKSEVDIIGHLDTLVTFFKPEAEKKSLEIILQNNIDKNNLTITTDNNKLSSILSNLIKNAIKYTNEGTIKVGLKVKNNQVLFSCKDTGIGIPKSRQEAIFNRFEQADIEDKQAHQGSGLGLAIVKSYVEILHGKIWVESEEGIGSTFYVSFPYDSGKKEEQNIPKEVKSLDSGIKNIKVLIVEDDEISSIHLSAIMEGKVKNISTAQNSLEAIDACKNDSGIDLILMDINMPVMDGIEATKAIREFNKDVIIIAQTAYALEGDEEKALDAGCNDYIPKPIKKDKLFELINKYF